MLDSFDPIARFVILSEAKYSAPPLGFCAENLS